MRIRHATLAMALGALMAGGLALPAHAAPTSIGTCYGRTDRNPATFYAYYCEGGGGSTFQAFAVCQTRGGTTLVAAGSLEYAGAGVWSRATCPSSTTRTGYFHTAA